MALALFGATHYDDTAIQSLSLDRVTGLYMGVGLLFLMAALLFAFSKKFRMELILQSLNRNAKQ